MLRNKKRAFTLIELLVVIAIIALLLSIMMPSLQKVKHISRAVVCRSNFKQAGIGFSVYEAEHNGYIVTSYWDVKDGTKLGTVTWWSIMLWEDIIPDTKLMLCPSLKLDGDNDKTIYTKADLESGSLNSGYWNSGPYGDRWYGSYGNILATDSDRGTLLSYPSIGEGDGEPFKVSRCIDHTSGEILLLDCIEPPEFIGYTWDDWKEIGATANADPPGLQNGWSNVWMRNASTDEGTTIGFSVRHNWASNALFFDGHAELQDGKTLWEQEWPSGGNPMDGF